MQRNQTRIIDHVARMIVGIFWIGGLLIAGSDNVYMPWVNIVGLVLFLGASILMGRSFQMPVKNTGTLIHTSLFKKQQLSQRKRINRFNKRCHTRYALSA